MLRCRVHSIGQVLACCVVVCSVGSAAATEDALPNVKHDLSVPATPAVPVRVIDPAVCADPAAADCSALIDNDKAEKQSRIAALLIRAKALVAISQPARALADFDTALKIDPTLTDVLNMRGELRRATGDRPRALADFTAVLKIRPDHEQARENRTSLSREIERIGAEMAVGKKSPPARAAPLK